MGPQAAGGVIGLLLPVETSPGQTYPVKVCMGRGAAAHWAAAAVEQRRNERRRAKAEVRAESDATAEADRLAEELRSWTGARTTAWLVLAGLHRHRGCWRAKRG